MTIRAEGFPMAGGAGPLLLARIILVPAIEIVRFVIQGSPSVLMTIRAVDKPLYLDRVLSFQAGGIRTGEKKDGDKHRQRYGSKQDYDFIFHVLPSLPDRTSHRTDRRA